jgi:hypothetical protein
MFTFNLCKKLIERGSFVKEDMQRKLDAYLAADRINLEQYAELMEMMA